MPHVRKNTAGADSFGHTWPHDDAVVEMPHEEAEQLLAIPDGGFTLADYLATETTPDAPGQQDTGDGTDGQDGGEPPAGQDPDTDQAGDDDAAKPAARRTGRKPAATTEA